MQSFNKLVKISVVKRNKEVSAFILTHIIQFAWRTEDLFEIAWILINWMCSNIILTAYPMSILKICPFDCWFLDSTVKYFDSGFVIYS